MRRIRSLHLVAVVCGLGAVAACGSAELTTPFAGEDAGSSNTGGMPNRDAGGGFMIGTKDASVQDEPPPVTPEDDAAGIGLCGDGTLQPGEHATTEMRVRVTAARVSVSSKGAIPVRFLVRPARTAAWWRFAETAASTPPRLATTATRPRATAARRPARSSRDGAARSLTNPA